jgi:hypothetical protein
MDFWMWTYNSTRIKKYSNSSVGLKGSSPRASSPSGNNNDQAMKSGTWMKILGGQIRNSK